MQIIDIPIQQGQWLTDALRAQGYRNIPTNVILKKTLPGLGATYGEIKARRNSIIIEPNVPVILGKTKNRSELLAVWEDCTERMIKDYLNDNTIPIKKLLTTPEGFNKIKKVCKDPNLNIDIYRDYFCLFDECEKIVQDVDFRDKITQPISDFFNFTNKAFVSATTLKMRHPEFENQGFKILKVKPQYNYKKDLELIVTDNYEIEVLQKIKALKNSDCICVFLNKTDSVEKLINTLGIRSQSKIFCSEKSVRKLRNIGYTDVFDQIDLPLAKYNFFTCRFFSAVDIEIPQKPDILILTNLKDANYTMIDPFTEAIQIYGRFRNNIYHRGQIPFNSLTHITNIDPSMLVKDDKQVDKMVTTWGKTYIGTYNRMQNATDVTVKQTLLDELQGCKYTALLDENGNFNHFSLDNLYNEERVKRYYAGLSHWLRIAYFCTGHFNVNFNERHYPFVTSFQSSRLTATQKRQQIVLELEKLDQNKINNPNFDIEPYKDAWRQKAITSRESGDLIVDAYDYLGKTVINSIGYSKPARLKEATNKAKAKKKEIDLRPDILTEIKQQYQIGQTVTKNDTKDFLKEIYRLKGIDINVTQITITDYCIVTSDNSANPATYAITGYK